MIGSPEIGSELIAKAKNYFYNEKYSRLVKNGLPSSISWFHDLGREGLRYQAKELVNRGELGYTGKGTDTAQSREDLDKTITSDTNTDTICADFEYDNFGINTIGKTIVDVAAGNSPFAEDMNFLYGQYGTRVIAVDAKYPLHTGDTNKVRMMAQNISELRKDFQDRGFADEVISRYGVTLVPKADFAHSVNEMLSLCKENGIVKIVPCHILKEIKVTELDDGTTVQSIGSLKIPKGISISHRVGVDIWRLDINKGEVDPEQLQQFLSNLDTPDALGNLQLWDSPDLLERRKNGFYTMDAINASPLVREDFDLDAFLSERGLDKNNFTDIDIDDEGNLILPQNSEIAIAA